MFDAEFGVAETAALVDVPCGTLGAWRHRGFLPAGPIDVHGVLEAALLRRCASAGLGPKEGSRIAGALRPLWALVLSPESGRRHVAARRDPDPGTGGGWSAAIIQERGLADQLADGAFVLDLRQLAEAVLDRLAGR